MRTAVAVCERRPMFSREALLYVQRSLCGIGLSSRSTGASFGRVVFTFLDVSLCIDLVVVCVDIAACER